MDHFKVERSIWIDAPPERVWQAVSEPDQIAQWFLPPAMGFAMRLADDGTLSVMMGEMGIAVARLEGLDAPRQLTSFSLPDDLIAATYTLEPDMNGTRVTVRLSGLEALPPDAAQERIAPLGTGWSKALENLKAYVEGRALPHPEGFVASVYGFRRETPQTVGGRAQHLDRRAARAGLAGDHRSGANWAVVFAGDGVARNRAARRRAGFRSTTPKPTARCTRR